MSSVLGKTIEDLHLDASSKTQSAIVSEASRKARNPTGRTSKTTRDQSRRLNPQEYVDRNLDSLVNDLGKHSKDATKDATKRRSNPIHDESSSSSSRSNDLNDVDRAVEQAGKKTYGFNAETRRVLRHQPKYNHSRSNPASRMPKRSSSRLMDMSTEHEKHLFGVSRNRIAKVYRDAHNIRTVKRRVVENRSTKPLFLSVYTIERKFLSYDELAEKLKQLKGFVAISQELEHRHRSFYNIECSFDARYFNSAFDEISSWKCGEDKLNVMAGRSA
mmetsp:Transcript_1361/g.2271  ORF Transcript_1361/g.2271 Transcript_1361/m.2271 type:complete len:274 (-) Transcript_1361:605-1426(-)